MVSKARIYEIYRYEVHTKSDMTKAKRYEKLLKANKLRSILLAMGNIDCDPIQNFIDPMTEEDFEEFIADNTTAKRRKEVFRKYVYEPYYSMAYND